MSLGAREKGERSMKSAINLSSEAWLLRGTSSVPGQLRLSAGQLSFVAQETGTAWRWQLKKLERVAGRPGLADQIDAGQKATVFDVPVSELEVEFPWYYFTGGVIVSFAGARYRISFGRPSNTRLPVDRSDPVEAGTRVLEEAKEIRTMRTTGRAWKAALQQARNP
jgi:hypothetical protein